MLIYVLYYHRLVLISHWCNARYYLTIILCYCANRSHVKTSTPKTSTPKTSTPKTSTPKTSTPKTSTPKTPKHRLPKHPYRFSAGFWLVIVKNEHYIDYIVTYYLCSHVFWLLTVEPRRYNLVILDRAWFNLLKQETRDPKLNSA